MKLKLSHLAAGVALAALAAACSTTGVPGFGSNGCRTIYVFHPGIGDANGVVQPVSNCGGLPRDRLAPVTALAEAETAPLQAETASAAATISPAALATRPAYPPKEPYPGPNEMLENADMAAFIGRIYEDYAEQKNTGAWGYVIVDSLAAGNAPRAQDILDAMAAKPQSEMMSANHLRPWVFAFNGRADAAQREMAQLRRLLPGATLLGHRALLAEGLGDTTAALAIYDEAPDSFDAPKPEDAATPGYLSRAIAFNGQRLLALRQAELLRALNRDEEAVNLLQALSSATPDDSYVTDRLEKARSGKDRRKVRSLSQAMAVALADEADMVEERQAIMGMMVGRGGRIPFNHLISSLRQSALLLDPNNGEVRLGEVAALYQNGSFEAALRMAQIGDAETPAAAAGLASTAGLAALELGSPETMQAMTDRALALDSSPESKVNAAGALTSAGYTDRAIRLIDQAMREGLSASRRPFALLSKGQARFQAGDITGAVQSAREARALEDNEDTQQFLASMLVKSPGRPEGLQIMRDMMREAPTNTGLMNNFGYSLIDGYANDEELDEGFKMLKEASRLTPDEPNLLDSLGWAYYQYGDYREARRYLDLAVAAYEPFDHWEILDHLGDVQWRLNEKDAARKSWQAAIDARPPTHELGRIAAKAKDGLTAPAPVRRDPPDVPRNPGRGGSNDI